MEEVIYGIVSNILSSLGSDAYQELGMIFGANEELKKLQDTLGTVEAFLVDAEQAAESSDLVKNWISRLQDVVYDADDLLDEFQYEHLRQKAHSAERVTQVQNFFSSLTTAPFHLTMRNKVKEIRERLGEVAADIKELDKRVRHSRRETDSSVGVGNTWSWRETDSSVKSEIIGRDQNKEDIINLLLELPTTDKVNVSIVGILGIGGLGKTALAQLVYNDAKIESHFSQKFWVCVSKEFDNKLLIKKIFKSIPGKEMTLSADLDLEQLQRQLREVLGGKRFLIVLDDVWNENSSKWYDFSEYLLDGEPGSKILVTTRNRRVASAMGIKSLYDLKGLNIDQSWHLFEHVVTFRRQNKIDAKLELIGKEVVKRCKGVPLAIKTLGCLMRQNPTVDFWSSVKDHETWRESLETEDGILPVLKLSYNHLPSPLRPCFAFCSIFPKDFDIRKDKLIQLWKAQGYITSLDLGKQYYNDLLSRSFFQEKTEEWEGYITCKMHDLVHDLAQSVAGSSFYTVRNDGKAIRRNVRHLLLECNPPQKFEIKGIRTILRSPYFIIEEDAIQSFSSLNPLRILDLSSTKIKKLPNSIDKWKHLRFLDLSNNRKMEELPDFITNLHNLQTLLLDFCLKLKELPKDISKLISLECLSIKYCEQLKYLPKGLGELTSLQRLNDFIVNIDEKEFSSSATLNELRDLNYLGGKLDIENLDMVRNVELESNEANLREKKHLGSLKLKWGDRGDRNSEKDELLLDNLEPHPNLKELVIYGYVGTRVSRWLSSITNLVTIRIEGRRCRYLPRLDHLPSLKFLSLQCFDALEYVADDGIGKEEDPSSSLSCSTSTTATMFFPSLKKLELSNCKNLKEWWRKNENEGAPSDLPCFPCLSSLDICNCPNLTYMPLFPFLDDKLRLGDASIKPLQQTLMMKTNNTSTASASSASSSRSSSTAPPLSNLKQLELRGIHDVETLPEEFLLNLTSLWSLTIDNCNKLESLPPRRTHCLSSLTELQLSNCPKLTAMPEWMPTLTSLKTLQIMFCPQLPSMPGGVCCRLTSLEELVFHGCDNLRALPEWIPTLTSLKSLRIEFCPQLRSMPGGICRLTSLEELLFHGCDNLIALPEWITTLTSLKTLQIMFCPQLPSMPGGICCRLTSLEELVFHGCDNLRALPEWIPTLTSLKSLRIEFYRPQLPSMPGGICRLTSLEELLFHGCDNLIALPEWITTLTSLKTLQIMFCPQLLSLPGGMQRLTSLKELIVKECPKLSETCKEESGIDWPRIAQIPNIYIEDRWVQGKRESAKASREKSTLFIYGGDTPDISEGSTSEDSRCIEIEECSRS